MIDSICCEDVDFGMVSRIPRKLYTNDHNS